MNPGDRPVFETRRPGMPERVGRYRVQGRIGKGAMGIVYAARDEHIGRDVAVKVMLTDLEGEPEIRARFFREAQLAGRLMHRNVVTIFDTGEDDGRLYIVMELLRGRTLGDFLKTPDLPIESKLDVMMQICEGLAAASAAGIFHRDVKPGNLFVQDDGSLKILDFGIARLASSSMTASGFIVGTPDYMSPEQARGKEVDERSDIFSAGTVFYYMLSLRKPFTAPDLPAVFHKVIHDDPLPLRDSEAPAPLARIVARMLVKDPTKRYQRFRDVLADLVRFTRRYDAETRIRAAAAFDIGETIRRGSADAIGDATALGVTPPPSVDTVLHDIAVVHPQLAERGLAGLKTLPLHRKVVDRIRERLEEAQAHAGGRTADLRSAIVSRDAAQREADAGNRVGALRQIEAALRRVPESPALAAAAERLRQAMIEGRATEQRVAARLAQSAEARAAGRLEAALTFAQEAAALKPDNTEARTAVASLKAAIADAAEKRRRQTEREAADIQRAIGLGRFKDAEAALERARTGGMDDATLATLDGAVSSARLVRAAQDRLQRARAEGAAAAWRAVQEGAGDREIAALEQLQADSPDPATTAELERLRAARAKAVENARRQAEVAAAVSAAEAALASGDLQAAAAAAEKALALVPDHDAAADLAAKARAQLREQAARETRLSRAAAHVEAARVELSRGRFERALREAARAAELDPGNEAPAAITRDALAGRAAADLAEAQEAAAAQRRRAAEPSLAAARLALRAGQFARARWAAESALAIDPACEEALGILAGTAGADPMVRDDTVDMSAVDPDDTASLRVEGRFAGAGEYVRRVVGTLRDAMTRRS